MDVTDRFTRRSVYTLNAARTVGSDDRNWVTVAVLDPAIVLGGLDRSPATVA